ncbi:MAG: hypothetical protein JNL36_07710 [Candidatus Kapabacteria bacterium]|nr:hypothetical protein [Candidatus Kapabacteria bacterium]
MAFTKHACSHPTLPGVTEEVFYSSNGLQLEFQIDDQHPATTPVAVLEVVVDFLSNRKLSKEEEQALTLIEDACILLSGKSTSTKTSKKKTTPVAQEVTA